MLTKRSAVLLSVLVAGIGVGLIALYLERYETEVSGGRRVPVLYLTQEVEPGAVVTEDVLAVRHLPAAYVEDRNVRLKDKSKVLGIEAVLKLHVHQELQWTDLAVRTDVRNLSQLVSPGKRAVTIRARQADSLGHQMIKPGDYVDVIATMQPRGQLVSTLLLQRILVVAVGLRTDHERASTGNKKESRDRRERRALTLSLDVDEAQLLALAEDQGRLTVAVRNPDDQRTFADLPEMRAASLIEARDQVRARRTKRSGRVLAPVRLTEAN